MYTLVYTMMDMAGMLMMMMLMMMDCWIHVLMYGWEAGWMLMMVVVAAAVVMMVMMLMMTGNR